MLVLTNEEVLTRVLGLAGEQVEKVVGQALLEEARILMRESLNQVPVLNAVLKTSGDVLLPVKDGRMIVVKLGYGGAASAYALYQHNAPAGWNYTKPGTKSHFLSDPVQQGIPGIQRNLVKRIGRLAEGIR